MNDSERIKELLELLELWADYYVNGLHDDDIKNLYIDTLAHLVFHEGLES